MTEDTGGIVMLHDESVGLGDDILRFEAGKPYRMFLIPQKMPIELLKPDKDKLDKEVAEAQRMLEAASEGKRKEAEEHLREKKAAHKKATDTAKALNEALKKGKARSYKKGDPGWFGPEDQYILLPGLTQQLCYWVEGKGGIKAPRNEVLRAKLDAAWEPARDWYGGVFVLFGTKMRDNEIILSDDQDPKWDFMLQRVRMSGIQAGLLKKAMATVSALDRDFIITCKKQGKSVRWESVTTSDETWFFDDAKCSPQARLKIMQDAKRRQLSLPKIIAKEYSEPELIALMTAKNEAAATQGAKTAAENASTPPTDEKDISSLLDS